MFTAWLRMYGMNTSIACCKKFLQFVGTSMLIITVPSNMFGDVWTFIWTRKISEENAFNNDILSFIGQRLPCSDKKTGWAWFSFLKKFSKYPSIVWQEIVKQVKRVPLFQADYNLSCFLLYSAVFMQKNCTSFLFKVSNIVFKLFHNLDFMSSHN